MAESDFHIIINPERNLHGLHRPVRQAPRNDAQSDELLSIGNRCCCCDIRATQDLTSHLRHTHGGFPRSSARRAGDIFGTLRGSSQRAWGANRRIRRTERHAIAFLVSAGTTLRLMKLQTRLVQCRQEGNFRKPFPRDLPGSSARLPHHGEARSLYWYDLPFDDHLTYLSGGSRRRLFGLSGRCGAGADFIKHFRKDTDQ